ncbi:unnamed protein product [Closterium sp. NIES-64]|nr:unnamed protein product [Closterium sp. NIES-64]
MDQNPHPAGVQYTTHGAAEGIGPATSSTATSAASAASAASATTAASTTTAASVTTASSAPSATAAASAPTGATGTPTPSTAPSTTPTPSAASTCTSTSTAPASSSSALAPLSPACAALPRRGRRSADRLETNEVGSSSRSERGQEGGGRTPLKDRGAGVTMRSSYSDYALFRR